MVVTFARVSEGCPKISLTGPITFKVFSLTSCNFYTMSTIPLFTRTLNLKSVWYKHVVENWLFQNKVLYAAQLQRQIFSRGVTLVYNFLLWKCVCIVPGKFFRFTIMILT